MKAVLLAAGEGVRLQPVTSTRPKHLIKITGKPILQYCLDAVKNAGITEVIIITHYMSDLIKNHFGDGSLQGLKISYIEQKELLGTGNAAAVAQNHVTGDFVLVYGDLLFASNAIKHVVESYQKNKAEAAMAVIPVTKTEDYGIIELSKDKWIKKIVEKPAAEKAPSNLANAGIYVFTTEVFEKLKKLKQSVRGEWELTDAITLLASEGKKILTVELAKDEWFDVGRPWDLLEANNWALKNMQHQVLGTIEPGAHIIGQVTVTESARIRSGAYIEGPAFFDEGSDIGPNCYIRPGTSIGKNCRVGNACEIKNSILMDGTHAGHLSYVGDSVLGEKCNLGAGTIIGNYRLDGGSVKMQVKDQVVNTSRRKLGAILGDNVKTGINALFMPGVKVGANSWVGPNFIVTRDLPSDSLANVKQQEIVQKKKK